MDSKNVIAAIALSSAVIVLYSLFFIPDRPPVNQNPGEKEKVEKNTDTPSIDTNETVVQISREEALKKSDRVEFENQNVKGSISLKGASIDDLTFKNYNIELNGNEKITLLGPRNIGEGYLIESGFVTSDKNIDIPTSDTIWSLIGNNKLTENSPIKLSWTNDQGITFEKEFSLDDKYLFSIKQKVINSTNNKYDLVFDKLLNIRQAVSMAAVYSSHGFAPALGEGTGERSESDEEAGGNKEPDTWDKTFNKGVKDFVRLEFQSYYLSNDFIYYIYY